MIAPIVARYEGEGVFTAMGRCARDCDAAFVIGQRYRLVEHQERSEASHRHFFAQVAELWATLPEDQAPRFQNPVALRKAALIATGYATQRQYVASSRAEALRVAAFAPSNEEYEIATVEGNIVTIWRAESQKVTAMGNKRFQASKDAVLGYIGNLLGVSNEVVTREAGKAA